MWCRADRRPAGGSRSSKRTMNTTPDPALDDESGFVSGMVASELPSANLPSRAATQAQGMQTQDLSQKSFVPLHNFDSASQQDGQTVRHSGVHLKDAGNGKLAVADVASGEFEPGWGAETKPRSQREVFLAEQAFEKGKREGEEETSKSAHAQGLKEGRESGYKQGFQDGSKERVFELEQRAEELAQQITDKRIETIANFLEQLMQHEKAAFHKRDTELMALMIAIFDKILPALAQENGEKEVQFFLKAILQRFENIPQMTITLAEGGQELVALLRERVDTVLSDDKSVDTIVSFQFDPSFSKADCKIAWAEGEVERRFQSLWQEVKHALQQHLPNFVSEQEDISLQKTQEEVQEKGKQEEAEPSSEHHHEAA